MTCHLFSLILCPFIKACNGNAALSAVQPLREIPKEWRRHATTQRKLFWQTCASDSFISASPASLPKMCSLFACVSHTLLSSLSLCSASFRVLLPRWNLLLEVFSAVQIYLHVLPGDPTRKRRTVGEGETQRVFLCWTVTLEPARR